MAITKKRMGARTRQRNVTGGRDKMVGVWVSAGEKKQLEDRAAEQGWSVPRLLLERALADESGVTRSDHDLMEFHVNALANEINKVGVNLNQIAHATNAQGSIPNELRGPLAEILLELRLLARRGRGLYDYMKKD